jgi:hypothetical protein
LLHCQKPRKSRGPYASGWTKAGASGKRKAACSGRSGDWWNAGEKWDRGRTGWIKDNNWNGPDLQTCHTCGWVASRFEVSRRREGLTWSHHREVSPFEPELADKLLDWVVEPIAHGKRRRSIADLRQRIREEYRCEYVGQSSLLALAPMAPKQTPRWAEYRLRWEPSAGMLDALKNLGEALDRCLLWGVPAIDVRSRFGSILSGSARPITGRLGRGSG